MPSILVHGDNTERRWLEGPRIMAGDLKRGRGAVEHITADELWGTGKKIGKVGANAPPKSVGLMGFGKFRDRQMSDIRDNEPGYWAWCIENVKDFEKRAEKAGLL